MRIAVSLNNIVLCPISRQLLANRIRTSDPRNYVLTNYNPTLYQLSYREIQKEKKDAIFDFKNDKKSVCVWYLLFEYMCNSPDGARTRDLGVAFIRMRIGESNPQ